jgi:hypothetical protein
MIGFDSAQGNTCGPRCAILQDESDALANVPAAHLQNDHAICHLESVHTSHHVEEALSERVMVRSKVTIAEREYLLQNVTPSPVTFVVEHALREDWTIDSDPQPVKIVDGKAFFRVNAEPGQLVRLHVGERHSRPMDEAN